MESYLAMKRHVLQLHTATGMNLNNTMLNEKEWDMNICIYKHIYIYIYIYIYISCDSEGR